MLNTWFKREKRKKVKSDYEKNKIEIDYVLIGTEHR